MNLLEIIGCGSGGLVILLTLLQITPFKINPWSWISKKVGNALNHDIIDTLDTQGKKLTTLIDICDEREANDCRYRILRFDDEIRHKKKHTKEHFDQILGDITTYEQYCEEHPRYKNNVAVFAIKLIKETYETCIEEGNFL